MDGQAAPLHKPRSNNRRQAILDAAAYRFRRQGYAATTMRDIATDAGMLAGSMYYHFAAKSALLLAVHQEGVRRIADAVDAALAVKSLSADPWVRLEAALAAHLESLLDGGDYAQVVIRDLPADEPDLKQQLIQLRDDYEDRFRTLTDALPVPAADKTGLRLVLLGAANWSKTWFRTDGMAPAQIAAKFVRLVRAPHHKGDSA
jgi:AcrR family transcriptional regulator